MRQVFWTNFAVSELKKIYSYHKMAAGDRVAESIKKSVFSAVKLLVRQPELGMTEENLKDLNEGHRYLVEGNYKIIYKVAGDKIFITDIFDCRQNPLKMKRKEK
jgi:plasmid stabilization system protein ParE